MDGRVFARFHVDVGIGDEVIEPLDLVTGEDWLGFGGIAPPSFPSTQQCLRKTVLTSVTMRFTLGTDTWLHMQAEQISSTLTGLALNVGALFLHTSIRPVTTKSIRAIHLGTHLLAT
jgi:hypothetical protein